EDRRGDGAELGQRAVGDAAHVRDDHRVRRDTGGRGDLHRLLPLDQVLGQQLQSGRLILQTKSDGPLGFLVVQYEVPGRLRGYASYDPERLEALRKSGGLSDGSLLGNGRLAMTIDPGGEQESHQGVVPLESRGLADAAITYFRQSEQLPTFIRLTAVRQFVGRSGDAPSRWHWRAGGLI
ncbi:MAG: Hsp33 family molecular chaperone HslO, partial [Hyphomicrobium sp.]|nr:Hsp33 family molecular chaperone HslO [Hyphomicrobium sp.]